MSDADYGGGDCCPDCGSCDGNPCCPTCGDGPGSAGCADAAAQWVEKQMGGAPDPAAPYTLHCGDSAVVLKTLPTASIDTIIIDPPAGINFMNLKFDSDRGGRDAWIAWLAGILVECRRVIKPGGHMLCWALPRTSHWTGMAIEDAGWEIRDKLLHLFGGAMPKGQNISKALDAAAGAERPAIGLLPNPGSTLPRVSMGDGCQPSPMLTAPATPEAAAWDGWNTQLKPGYEEWYLCRAPLAAPTIAENVARYGTGALHIDACRVPTGEDLNGGAYSPSIDGLSQNEILGKRRKKPGEYAQPAGRYPSNLILSHSRACIPAGYRRLRANGGASVQHHSASGFVDNGQGITTQTYGDADGYETVAAWQCSDDCPVAELDRQSGDSPSGARPNLVGRVYGKEALVYGEYAPAPWGPGHDDTGGASRYFTVLPPPVPFRYQAKPSKAERQRGTGRLRDGGANRHPTVKSTELLLWFAKFITPSGGTILDCFMGSGTTGVAAMLGGWRFVGIDQDAAYCAIAEHRIHYAAAHRADAPPAPNVPDPEPATWGPLFAGLK